MLQNYDINDLISYNWSLAESLNEADNTEPTPTMLGSIRYEECKNRIYQHSVAEKSQRSKSLCKNTERNLFWAKARKTEKGNELLKRFLLS